MITITRHEVVKQGDIVKGLIIGVTYKDDITGRESYRDVRFTASDFPSNPAAKVDVRGKIKAWLNAVPEGGKSILQSMKEQASVVPETSKEVDKGNPERLIDETISEA